MHWLQNDLQNRLGNKISIFITIVDKITSSLDSGDIIIEVFLDLKNI